jgi:hypothetical protein
MKTSISTGLCAAIVGFAAAAAMSAQQAAPTSQTNGSSDKKVTVTGCLTQAPPSASDAGPAGVSGATGTSGTAGSAATAPSDPATATFLLTNATPSSPEDSSTAAGAADASSATGAGSSKEATSGQTYRLVANPAALSPHVGKKLELTGTILDEKAAQAAGSASGPNANAPALRVEAGKVLAASCKP